MRQELPLEATSPRILNPMAYAKTRRGKIALFEPPCLRVSHPLLKDKAMFISSPLSSAFASSREAFSLSERAGGGWFVPFTASIE
jgi:hypothetical protein